MIVLQLYGVNSINIQVFSIILPICLNEMGTRFCVVEAVLHLLQDLDDKPKQFDGSRATNILSPNC